MERYLERSYDMTMKRIVLPEEEDLQVPDPVGATNLEIEEEEDETGTRNEIDHQDESDN